MRERKRVTGRKGGRERERKVTGGGEKAKESEVLASPKTPEPTAVMTSRFVPN